MLSAIYMPAYMDPSPWHATSETQDSEAQILESINSKTIELWALDLSRQALNQNSLRPSELSFPVVSHGLADPLMAGTLATA